MELDFYTLCVLYLAYSFLGWIGETVVATIKGKSFVSRGVAAGPFCFVYGLAAVVMAVGLTDLRQEPVFLFLGCTVSATVIEWLTAKLLERVHRRRWWDYSDKKFNLDGYVCLQYSLLWGALGMVSVLWTNDLLAKLYHLLPSLVGEIAVWICMGIAIADQIGSVMAVGTLAAGGQRGRFGQALGRRSDKLRDKIVGYVEKRIQRAYPSAAKPAKAEREHGLNLSDLFWLFMIGAFLGDIVETLYCRVVAGVWMSRSSVVWGPFSVVWGLALVMASVLLRRDKGRSDRTIFLFGVVMGGVYEYVCSAVGELLFGVVFWDYSGFLFNLGGRINLLYCFFWGIAAVVWLRYGDPLVEKMMAKLRRYIRPWMTITLAVVMTVNMTISALALARYNARTDGVPPANRLEEVLDERFDNERMERIYPNAKKAEMVGQKPAEKLAE